MPKPAYYKEDIYFTVGDSRELMTSNQETIVKLLAQNEAVGVVGVFYEEGFPLYFISHFMLANLGYDYQEFMEKTGGNYLELVYPKDRVPLMQELKDERNAVHQYRLRHKDGENIWVSSISHDASTLEGRLIRIASVRIIDEVHRREMELLETLGQEYDQIAYVDVKNKNFEWIKRQKGHSQEHLNGSLDELREYFQDYLEQEVHPEDIDLGNLLNQLSGLTREQLKHGGSFQEIYRCKAGRQYQWMELHATFGGSYTRDTAYLILGFRNVDSRMRRELEANQLLTLSLERARRSNMAKRDFLSKMSHDLRTPLNSILSISELAGKAENMEQLQGYFSVVKAAGNHLLRLVDEILEMSEIESGNMEIREKVFHLEDFMKEVQGTSLPELELKRQRLSVDIGRTSHRRLQGDEEKLQKILTNLLSNAIKYSPEEGEIRLEVEELPQLRTGYGQYRFSVTDWGIGIDPSMQEKIFEPFERVEDTRTSKQPDVGLGLAITRNLVDMLHGTIQVDSTPGKGSCFAVTLELKLSQEVEEEPKDQEYDLRGMRLLLVEDNEVNREIAADILMEQGIQVEEAVNGAEAVERFIERGIDYYDVIFMDIQMPVMNGYEAAGRIRALTELHGDTVPIIAVTADAFREDVKLAHQAGMNGHLKKPLNFAEVYHTLAGYQGNRGSVDI